MSLLVGDAVMVYFTWFAPGGAASDLLRRRLLRLVTAMEPFEHWLRCGREPTRLNVGQKKAAA
jgi:hypothetical protein